MANLHTPERLEGESREAYKLRRVASKLSYKLSQDNKVRVGFRSYVSFAWPRSVFEDFRSLLRGKNA